MSTTEKRHALQTLGFQSSKFYKSRKFLDCGTVQCFRFIHIIEVSYYSGFRKRNNLEVAIGNLLCLQHVLHLDLFECVIMPLVLTKGLPSFRITRLCVFCFLKCAMRTKLFLKFVCNLAGSFNTFILCSLKIRIQRVKLMQMCFKGVHRYERTFLKTVRFADGKERKSVNKF